DRRRLRRAVPRRGALRGLLPPGRALRARTLHRSVRPRGVLAALLRARAPGRQTVTVVSDRLDAGVADAVRIMVTTPEGVPLVFTVALVGERLAAFLIDLVALVLVLLAILLGAQAVVGIAGEIAVAAVLVVTFLLRNGWFTFFEITSQIGRAHV